MNEQREQQTIKAAHEYIQSDSVAAGNEVLAFGDFINGAKWADFHPQWIPVEEELPKENEEVLAYNAENEEVIACDYHHKMFHCWPEVFGKSITHWMPLPTPPQGRRE